MSVGGEVRVKSSRFRNLDFEDGTVDADEDEYREVINRPGEISKSRLTESKTEGRAQENHLLPLPHHHYLPSYPQPQQPLKRPKPPIQHQQTSPQGCPRRAAPPRTALFFLTTRDER